ncbi:hypothetical protein ABIB42_000471 [Massilia sp. UYP32]|uniref:Potassium channel domain-containing protein n=1 Tax=Massilia timonae CCUG 45783 TaxID=883126 RepID=K9DEZ2_9BURK|nr:potassium channel family protein [Massilia timonae]EKU81836.1 hypothetical protein HMPREF9710_02790 [Massilia timonae CCUG 45783]
MDNSRILELKVQPVDGIAEDLKANRPIIFMIAAGVGAYIAFSTILYWLLEMPGRPFLDSLYFTVINVTTVGFGDIHPTSDVGKIIAMMNAVIGLVIFGFLVAAITAALQPSEFSGEATAMSDLPLDQHRINAVDALYHALATLIKDVKIESGNGRRLETRDGVPTGAHIRVRGGTPDDHDLIDIWIDIHVKEISATDEIKPG